MHPTHSAYTELQTAFDYFNHELFDGKLTDCLITFQRKNRTYGYFSAGRFEDINGLKVDELALNPVYFTVIPLEEIMQTLVHEMVHQWQQYFGKKGRRGYHNKEWSEKMEEVGLMPSSTGKPGGKKTGEKMMDYIIEGGLFEIKLASLLSTNFRVSWFDRFPPISGIQKLIQNSPDDESYADLLDTWGVEVDLEGNVKSTTNQSVTQSRLKQTCPSCHVSIWGKPSLKILCMDCDEQFSPAPFKEKI